ncbi:tetratricopeptide repeat protein [Brevibacillus sp. SYSU BS000544]|uniref:tetratricopeptide repeat protein n=1 Tax=Brevibacillus sp. SYSU BS000544 TaxID=3416443 RepID=UPI003CE519D5
MSDFIEFTNEHGQKIELPRETYREKIIPQKLEQYWDEKEMLRQFAIELVAQGFNEEGAKAADRLLELFGPIEPALIFRAVVHMQAQEFDPAKQLLLYVIHHYPNSGNAYTNLAKIFAYEGDEEKAFEILEGGLVKDPNQDNGLDWYVANFLEHGKKEQLFERLELIAKQEGAWRPQLIMGRLALEDENLLLAMDKYQEAITKSGNSEVTIMNVTGELGQAGYVYQLIQVAEKYWQPTFEYPYTGFNYANALISTDQKQQAVTVLKAMLPHIREDYKEVVNRFLEQLPQELLEESHGETSSQEADKKPWWKVW